MWAKEEAIRLSFSGVLLRKTHGSCPLAIHALNEIAPPILPTLITFLYSISISIQTNIVIKFRDKCSR